jgi:GNAT superfamily N-acetyltransferase
MLAHPMTAADLPRAAALSELIGWNQTEMDWRVFLDAGLVRALDDGDPTCLAATAAVLPVAPELAWISMVLVRPDHRRAGHATALLRWALEQLDGTRCIALDATPAGREVYRQLGFADVLGFARWRLDRPLPAPSLPVRPLRDEDWPQLLALDEAAFGADRGALLRGFAQRLPQAAWIAHDGSAYALGRDGLRAPQIGPVVAADASTAQALIAAASHALGKPALLDLADAATDLRAALLDHGAQLLRPFTRMARGAPPPGDMTKLVAMAGPEFG